MDLVLRAIGNPVTQRFNLRPAEPRFGIRRRHPLGFVTGSNALNQLARVRFARHDSRITGVTTPDACFAKIQAKTGLTRLLVAAVTAEAIVSQNRSNIEQIVWSWPVGL